MRQVINRKVLGLWIVILLLCSPGMETRAAQDEEIEITDTYITKDPTTKKNYPAEREIEGKQYILKDVKYEIIKQTPIVEKMTITEKLSKTVYDNKKNVFEDRIIKKVDGQDQVLQLEDVQYNPKKLTVGNGTASITVIDDEIFVDPSQIPDQKVVDYKDPDTGITVKVSLDKKDMREVGYYEDIQLEMTFYVIDAPYFVFGNEHIPNAGNEPSVHGYEELYLSYLGLGDDYQITDAAWAGEAYMQNGELCRDAVCYVKHYIPTYEVTYGGQNVKLPEIDGYEAIATYIADVDKQTGEKDYTIQAIATYTAVNTGLTTMQITMLSLGVIIIIIVALMIIFDLSHKRKKEKK